LLEALPENAQHQGKRDDQQDAFGFWADTERKACTKILAVACDGMGGLSMGQEAAQVAVHSFIESFLREGGRPAGESLLEAVRSANAAVFDMASRSGCEGHAGTTLVAALVDGGGLSWISVGDSHIYLYRQGRLQLLNREHNLGARLERLVEGGRLSREEADAYGQRDALTSFIGIEELEEIDASGEAVPLQDGDCLLLCTDGLYRSLSDTEMVSVIHGEGADAPQGRIAEALIARAVRKNLPQQDNLTALVVRMQPAGSRGGWTRTIAEMVKGWCRQ
jgi:protein phosphatase